MGTAKRAIVASELGRLFLLSLRAESHNGFENGCPSNFYQFHRDMCCLRLKSASSVFHIMRLCRSRLFQFRSKLTSASCKSCINIVFRSKRIIRGPQYTLELRPGRYDAYLGWAPVPHRSMNVKQNKKKKGDKNEENRKRSAGPRCMVRPVYILRTSFC